MHPTMHHAPRPPLPFIQQWGCACGRRGDLFMFHGFTFHAAAPNTGPAERGGLYIKVYAGL